MSSARPLVQFVSKPIVAPFRDGTKCLVRDLVTHFEGFDAAVMGTSAGAPELDGKAEVRAIYSSGGGFAPGITQNLRAAAWLAFERRAAIWHFVFAPNPRSSQVGHLLERLRGVPVVQTVASPPRSFDKPGQLLFGDRVVVQSEWTRARFAEALAKARETRDIRVVPPPVPRLALVLPEAKEAVRARLRVPAGAPLFLYPGDLEVSQGASRVAELVRPLRERMPEAHVVFAYRDKSVHADEHARALAERLPSEGVHFEKNVPDIHALLAASTAILFPVEDLYGKVDLPIVLLEALSLGTPVLALDEGPLASLEGAWRAPFSARPWLERAVILAEDADAHAEQVALGRRAAAEHYAPSRVAAAYETIYRELVSKGL
jgi:phosphatidylinositol alpha-1,6-mannosyltransferase